MTNYLDDKEIELIEKVNNDLLILIKKYGKKELYWAAQWLFHKPIVTTKIILKDDKAWFHTLDWSSEQKPPSIYRIRKYPQLDLFPILDADTPQVMNTIDYEFRLTNHQLTKRDCGCIDSIYEYEMI